MKKYMILAIASVFCMTQVQAEQMFSFTNKNQTPIILYIWQMTNQTAVKCFDNWGVIVKQNETYTLDVEAQARTKCSLVLEINTTGDRGFAHMDRYYLSGESNKNNFFVTYKDNKLFVNQQPNNVSVIIPFGAATYDYRKQIEMGDTLAQLKEKFRLSKK